METIRRTGYCCTRRDARFRCRRLRTSGMHLYFARIEFRGLLEVCDQTFFAVLSLDRAVARTAHRSLFAPQMLRCRDNRFKRPSRGKSYARRRSHTNDLNVKMFESNRQLSKSAGDSDLETWIFPLGFPQAPIPKEWGKLLARRRANGTQGIVQGSTNLSKYDVNATPGLSLLSLMMATVTPFPH